MAADSTGIVRRMLDLMPSANVWNVGDGLNTAGYTWIQPASSDRDQWSVKFDHNFNAQHRLMFSWNRETSTSLNGFQSQRFPNTPGGDVVSPDNAYALKIYSNLRPTVTNEFSVGVLRSQTRSLAPWEVGSGLSSLPTIGGQPFLLDFVSVTDPILTDNDPQGRLSPNYQYSDNLSWTRGKHSFKAGAAVWFTSSNGYNSFDVMPRINIGGGIRPPNLSGIPDLGQNRGTAEGILNDLSGSVTSVVQAFNSPGGDNPRFVSGEYKARVWKSREHFFYFKDDWRVSRNVTLNLGVRYEYYQVPFDKNGKTAATVGGQAGIFGISGTDSAAMFRPGATGGSLSRVELIGPNTAQPNRTLYRPDRNNFAPAVGVSWQLPKFWGGATIVRAGYSMGYERTALRLIDVFSGDQPGLRNRVVRNFGTYTNLAAAELPLTPSELPLATVPITDRTQTLRAFQDDLRQPYVQNWNFSIQREIKGGFLLDLRYVGNKSTKGIRSTNLNEANIFENGILEAFVAAQRGQESPLLDRLLQPLRGARSGSAFMRFNTTLAGYLAGNSVGAFANYLNTQNVNGRNGGLIAAAGLPENFVVVNPQFSAATFAGNFANSTYHSFQVDVSKRFSKGFSMQANYTWAKALGEEEGEGQEMIDTYRTFRNRRIEKRLLSFSVPHIFRSNALWDLPFGPGRKFLNSRRGVVGKLLEHWQIGSVFNAFAGVPVSWESGRSTFNAVTGDNTATLVAPLSGNIGKIEKRPNGVFFYGGYTVVRDPQIQGITNLDGIRDRSTLQAVVDPQGQIVAVNPTPGTLGSSANRFFFGPGYFAFDMNLLKTVSIGESKQLQFGITADNVLNRTFFTDPDTFLNRSINSPSFGQITGTDSGPRIVILSLRFNF
jgi:hypothetical protein